MRLSYHDDFERMGVPAVERALIANLFVPNASTQARLWLASRYSTPPEGRKHGPGWINGWLSAVAVVFAAFVRRGSDGA
jgi:hypothetical protein